MQYALEADLIKKMMLGAMANSVGRADERQAREDVMNEMNWGVT